MDRRFSEMTPYELTVKIGEFTDKARKAEQMGMISEYAVYERKIQMASAYLMDPEAFREGQTYDVNGRPFTINRLKGRVAWGTFSGEEEQKAYPISMLKKREAD